jgi:hypothetical protein
MAAHALSQNLRLRGLYCQANADIVRILSRTVGISSIGLDKNQTQCHTPAVCVWNASIVIFGKSREI